MFLLEQRLYSIFILTLIQIGYTQISGTVSIDPTTACVGDQITVSCTLEVPNSATHAFFSILTDFIVGNSDVAISELAVDGTGTHGGVALSKLMATASGGNTTSVQGSITLLSYTTGDNGTKLGCANEYYINGNTSDRDTVSVTTTVIQAAPPSTPNIVVSLSSLSPTDCTNTLISWTAPAGDRTIDRYYVYRDSTLLSVSTDTQYTDTDQLMVNTPYSYSVIANSCAGNSSGGVYISTITGYSLVDSPPLFLSYDQSTSMLTVDWGLVPGSEPLLLAYSLQLNYSHSQYGTTNEFATSSSFSLLSDITLLSLLQLVTPHNFSTADGVVTNITACISIASQCGTPFSGDMLCGFFNSDNPPATTQPTISTFNILTTDATKPTEPTQLASLPIPIIAAAVGGGALALFILIIILVVIMLCICCGKKSKEHSPTVPKQPIHIYDEINETPPAHYDYIDIDTIAIKNPSTQRPTLSTLESGDTHTYTHMNPVRSDQMVISSPYENISS